jgi:hypothetical protein
MRLFCWILPQRRLLSCVTSIAPAYLLLLLLLLRHFHCLIL